MLEELTILKPKGIPEKIDRRLIKNNLITEWTSGTVGTVVEVETNQCISKCVYMYLNEMITLPNSILWQFEVGVLPQFEYYGNLLF